MSTVDMHPHHIALIPDGNRRWARERDLEPWIGHQKGAETLEVLLRAIYQTEVDHFTVWGSSRENLTKRPLREKKELLAVYATHFKRLLESDILYEKDVCVRVLGAWRSSFPAEMIDLIDQLESSTASHRTRHLNILLAYSGDEDMLDAINMLVEKGDCVDRDDLKSALVTRYLPPVDLMIRTGGEPHMSAGFLMWELANAEFYFSDLYFPDFQENALAAALHDFAERRRKKGS